MKEIGPASEMSYEILPFALIGNKALGLSRRPKSGHTNLTRWYCIILLPFARFNAGLMKDAT
jgi:hypothetical protein